MLEAFKIQLDKIQKQIDDFTASRLDKRQQLDLILDSQSSGNYSRFGADTVKQEAEIIPKLINKANLLTQEIIDLENRIREQTKLYTDTLVLANTPEERQAQVIDAQTQNIQAQVAAQTATFATEKSKTIFYIGVGLALFIVGAVVYYAFFNKTKPKPE